MEYHRDADRVAGLEESRVNKRMRSRVRMMERRAYATGALVAVPKEERQKPAPKREGKTGAQRKKHQDRRNASKRRQRAAGAVTQLAVSAAAGLVAWPEGVLRYWAPDQATPFVARRARTTTTCQRASWPWVRSR